MSLKSVPVDCPYCYARMKYTFKKVKECMEEDGLHCKHCHKLLPKPLTSKVGKDMQLKKL